jgi:CheY-like chemotaxis protein
MEKSLRHRRRILWVDDEVDFLRPHIHLLEERGYQVTAVTNGEDAISLILSEPYDLILLDQMMPGIDGLSVLSEIRRLEPDVPIVMVTKSEEEAMISEALGRRADDFLAKPLNARQLISLVTRVLEMEDLVEERIVQEYAAVYRRLSEMRAARPDWHQWSLIHQELSIWDLMVDRYPEAGLRQTHQDQRNACNTEFAKYVGQNYVSWIRGGDVPLMSPELLKERVFPLLDQSPCVVFLLLDCMRFDQWLAIEPIVKQWFRIERDHYYSILPSATPYARNAIFSGLFPLEMAEQYPHYWRHGDEGGQNRYEAEFLREYIRRLRPLGEIKSQYVKIIKGENALALSQRASEIVTSRFFAIVVNFVDILTHYRSESDVVKEITPDEGGFRALTRTWFINSPVCSLLRELAGRECMVVVTSDHGSICGRRATIIYGGREISPNLRYKYGPGIRCNGKHALFLTRPDEYMLPQEKPGTRYCIAKEDYYFIYPTHPQEYEREYRGSFQHGGVSMEEMILPLAIMTPK